MPVDYGLVGAPSTVSAADGINVPVLQGKQGDQLVSELNGKYYTDAYRSNVYWASAAATGIVTTIFSNTTYVGLLLWNPQGSGKNLVPIRAMQGRILAATTVCAFGHSFLLNAGAGVGTAAPLSAFTAITATRGAANNPGLTGQGNSVALVGGGATFTTALAWGRANGLAVGTETTAIVEQPFIEDFDGTLIIPPGTLMAVFAATAAQGGTWVPSITWAEKPL